MLDEFGVYPTAALLKEGLERVRLLTPCDERHESEGASTLVSTHISHTVNQLPTPTQQVVDVRQYIEDHAGIIEHARMILASLGFSPIHYPEYK